MPTHGVSNLGPAMVRHLGNSGIVVTALGVGCWAIGGSSSRDGNPTGFANVDDKASLRALHAALDHGITLFDTADVYGTGHSERLLGRALRGRRSRAVVATKFGYTYDEQSRAVMEPDTNAGYIRSALESSLRRLRTDYVDLYQLHVWPVPRTTALQVFRVLDTLVDEGRIRAYGWSARVPGIVRDVASRSNLATIQHPLNVLADSPGMLTACEHASLAFIANAPLAMGVLTGKYTEASRFSDGDIRGGQHEWVPYFASGRPREEYLRRLAAVREILTSGGRTLAQGALGWIWARSPNTVPIPGFRTVAQVEENAGALRLGPLTVVQMREISALLRQRADPQGSVEA